MRLLLSGGAPYDCHSTENKFLMRILVTGGTGFVGRWAVSALRDAGHDLVVCARRESAIPGCRTIEADLLDERAAGRIMDWSRPEIVLHLGWYVEHGKFWNARENLDWVAATLRLATAANTAGVRRFVSVGTCMEYALDPDTHPLVETAPTRPVSLYGISKSATRQLLEGYFGPKEIEFAWGRLFFIFGPNEQADRLVSSIAISLLSGRPALLTSGAQVRDFCPVQDAGEALAALALSKVTGSVNIGSGHEMRIAELAEEIRSAVGVGELRFGALPDRTNEPRKILANIDRLRSEVGFTPKRAMHERIVETVNWWRDRINSRASV
jgi:UDP-glucose 4-epimerase